MNISKLTASIVLPLFLVSCGELKNQASSASQAATQTSTAHASAVQPQTAHPTTPMQTATHTDTQNTADWTPIFKSIESGCSAMDEGLRDFFYYLVKDNEASYSNHNLPPYVAGHIQAPPAYRHAVGDVIDYTQGKMVHHHEGESLPADIARLPIRGTYYNLPVKAIEHLRVDGVASYTLILATPLANAKSALAHVHYTAKSSPKVIAGQEEGVDAYGAPILSDNPAQIDGDAHETRITCFHPMSI